MRNSLYDRVVSFAVKHGMFTAGQMLGVAVSGGADSVALLRVLFARRAELGLRLMILHFNHQLRGAESDADEQFVRELAAAHALPFIAGHGDVRAASDSHGWNLEDAGRRLRYAFFASVARSGKVSCVAVAHTADDQAETVLSHLLRGTGPGGIAAIYPVAENIIRPLLQIRRAELHSYLRSLGQTWREDPSNQDTTRLRARIRQNLLPLIEHDFQPEAVSRLGRLASLAREDAEFWSAFVVERFGVLTERTTAGIAIRACDLLRPLSVRSASNTVSTVAQTALAKRLVRHAVAQVRENAPQLDAHHVDQVLRLATSGKSNSHLELPGSVVVERNFDRLVFRVAERKTLRQLPAETELNAHTYQYKLALNGREAASVSVPEIGSRFQLKVIDWPSPQSDTKTGTGALDLDLLQGPLVLRNLRPGDSYRPRGRRQAHKLKSLLLEGRITACERAGWPVLTSAGRLVWARGFPVAHDFAAREGTKAVLMIAEEKL